MFQWNRAPHIQWSIAFKEGSLPIRTCNDSDPVTSWRNYTGSNHNTAVGCNNLVLSGTNFGIYIFANLCPIVFGMSARSAAQSSLANYLILTAELLLVGASAPIAMVSALLQLAIGLAGAFVCLTRERRAREHFALSKGLLFSAAQNSNLLHTLVPANVVAALAARRGGELVASPIAHCTVMFCALAQQGELQAAFSGRVALLLDELFCAFDDAVEASGMYKYQHVGEW